MIQLIEAEWPAPDNITAVSTTRIGGVSATPYDGFNLGDHVGDVLENVQANRLELVHALHLAPEDVCWLQQVHGTLCVESKEANNGVAADASYSRLTGRACCVMTADCLPILLCDTAGSCVAAVHGGWRGLAANIIDVALKRFEPDADVMAWLGPAIGPSKFEVGLDVYHEFMALGEPFEAAFVGHVNPKKRYLDIYQVARIQLQKRGVRSIYGGDFCTYSQSDQFFSYRRDGAKTGRLASLIWINREV